MDWFTDWFNSPYYHTLYKERDKKEAEIFIDNLIAYLKIPKGSKIIDIACGKGRHAKYFNEKNMDVLGIDLSPNSIKSANKYSNNTLKYVIHDMREVVKMNYFDVATNIFTSFGYFEKEEDQQKAIISMANNLKNEGVLIIDFMNVNKVINNLVLKEKKRIDNITFNIERRIKNNHIIKEIKIIDQKNEHFFQEKVKVITLNDFSNLINNAGMKIINTFGNYNLENYNESSSDRLILICKNEINTETNYFI